VRIAAADAVLDVGCGCGALSLVAAAQSAARTVVGIDLSESMLERARDRAGEAGVADRVSFLAGDAQVIDLGAAGFDAVISRFGVMFFDDPGAAFRNLARLTRPAGGLAFVCWAPQADNPWYSLPKSVAAAHVPPMEPPPSGSPGPFGLDDPERTTALLNAAGWRDIEVQQAQDRRRSGGRRRRDLRAPPAVLDDDARRSA
jgi:SAM-dependent methyltransferase